MGGFSTVMTLVLGIKFLIKPVMTTKSQHGLSSPKNEVIQSIFLRYPDRFDLRLCRRWRRSMMLLILTSVLGYELKTAVGTSVFIMPFTADGFCRPFCNWRHAGSHNASFLCTQHTSLGMLPQKFVTRRLLLS